MSLAVGAGVAGAAGDLLSKRDARRAASQASAATCRAVGWCKRYEVVPAQRCTRAGTRTVYCAVAFFTANGRRCGGVVGISRAPKGRLDRVMAVPSDCSAGRGAG